MPEVTEKTVPQKDFDKLKAVNEDLLSRCENLEKELEKKKVYEKGLLTQIENLKAEVAKPKRHVTSRQL